MNRIIAGRYELLTEWARGGMSVVYLAKDTKLNKNWAVKKVLKSCLMKGAGVSNDLLAEANMMKNLTHHALPRIIDVVEEENAYYIVMDFVEGDNLLTILTRRGPQKQEHVIKWGIELASALDYLHRQDPPIIYRDMKPANVMLTPNGELKIIDFGIARTYKTGKADDTTHLGTRGYAAPEQFETEDGSPAGTDQRTDVYGLGMTMYVLLTGNTPEKDPYGPVPIRQVNPQLSAGLEKIILKCTMLNPKDRYQSMEEVLHALLNYHKMDSAYVKAQKRKLKKAFLPIAAGCIMLILSAAAFAFDAVIENHTYESLLISTGNSEKDIENLKKAAGIKPGKEDAYEGLVTALSKDGGLDEEDVSVITGTYAENITQLKEGSDEYLNINYILGEDMLVYFTGKSDNSIRNKLFTAEQFFSAIASTNETDFEGYELAVSYVELADFYRQYIMTGGNEFAKTATAAQKKKFFSDCKDLVNALPEGNSQLKIAGCAVAVSIIDAAKTEFARSSRKAAIECLDMVLEEANSIDAQTKDVKKKIDELIAQMKSVRSYMENYREKEESR